MAYYNFKRVRDALPREMVQKWLREDGTADYDSMLWVLAAEYIEQLKKERDDALLIAEYARRQENSTNVQGMAAGLELIEKTMRDKPEAPSPKMRPDSEGWWWRHYRGKNGDEWEIGKAEMIYWEDAGEPVQERVLAWTTGGCWTRCDYINMRTDAGTRWFKATPPVLDSANSTDHPR